MLYLISVQLYEMILLMSFATNGSDLQANVRLFGTEVQKRWIIKWGVTCFN